MLHTWMKMLLGAVALGGMVVGVSMLWEPKPPACEGVSSGLQAPVLFAARGAPDHVPSPTWVGFTMSGVFENTLPAFERATARGMNAIDLPARLSKDGVLVVMEDEDVTRTTDGQGLVADMKMSELSGLDAGGGARIPTVEQVLDIYSDRVGYHIRLPDSASDAAEIAEALGELLANHSAKENVWVASANVSPLEALRRKMPSARTILKVGSASDLAAYDPAQDGACVVGVELPSKAFNAAVMKTLDGLALAGVADDVRTGAEWTQLKELGVRGGLTHFTELLDEAPQKLPPQGEVEIWD